MDKDLLLAINQGWANPLLDQFFAWISQDIAFSTPVMLVVLVFFYRRFGRDGVKFWLLTVLMIVIGDQLGVMIKDLTLQLRPCNELEGLVRRTESVFNIRCSRRGSGMPSNHALNFFLFTVFTGSILRWPAWWIGFLLLSCLVALSRVYLGVHYPSQALAGAMIGSLLGAVAAALMLWKLPLIECIRHASISTREKQE